MNYHKLASLTFRATTAAQNGVGFNMLHLLWICDSLLYMQNITETSVDWPFSYILLFRHLFFSLLHHREALAGKDRERKSNSTAAVTYNREHLELLSHLIFSQVFSFLDCPFSQPCPQVIFDDIWSLIAWHCGSLGSKWSKFVEFKRSRTICMEAGGETTRKRNGLSSVVWRAFFLFPCF